MIFRIFYSYHQDNPRGGCGEWVDTDKIVDANSGEELEKIKEEIKKDNDCGYRTNYSFTNIIRLDK